MVLASAALGAAPALAQSFSYISAPTDQIGVPAYVSGTELTPDGSLYTGWVELRFLFGRRLRPVGTVSQELLDGRSPIIRYHLRDGPVAYTVTIFSAAIAREPVNFIRIRWHNRGRSRAIARWGAGLRYSGGATMSDGVHTYRFQRDVVPSREGYYDQPGAPFDPRSAWAFTGNAVTRDGWTLLLVPRPGPGEARRLTLRPGGSGAPVNEGTVFGEVDYREALAAGAGGGVELTMPVVPIAAADPAEGVIARTRPGRELAAVLRSWHRLFARAMQIRIPEPKVQDTFYTSLANMALARYRSNTSGWVQTVNKLNYNAFWLRDGSVIANAFDVAGLHDLAAEDLEFFPTWQQSDGLFISRAQQYDGFGQALWAIGRHAELTRDRAFARRMLGPVSSALGWFEHEQLADPLGLMPLSTPGDNELTTGHITGDDFWAADGVREAIALAGLLGRADLVRRWTGDLQVFLRDLRAALRQAEARTGGWIPPAIEANGGQDWGNLWASYPEQVLPPSDPAVTATLRHVLARFREGIATYYNGVDLHDYLGFRVFETELLRGEQSAVVDGLYSELAHTTATNGGFEVGVHPGGARVLLRDLAPHGWFAAEYVDLLRNMLVREDARGVVLMSALSPAWLLPGRSIAVRAAATTRGQVDFTLRAESGGATLSWRAALLPGTRLSWPVPAAVDDVRARGMSRDGRTITLTGRSGRLRVSWRLKGPFPSFASTVRRVMAEWRAGQ